MVLRDVHLFGSNSAIDPATESKLLETGAARHEAIGHTFQAKSEYQMAAAQDLQGNTLGSTGINHSLESSSPAEEPPINGLDGDPAFSPGSAMDHFERSVTNADLAKTRWKQAEYRQAELVSHMRSQPNDSAIRPEVTDEMNRRDPMEDVLSRASNGSNRGALWDKMDIDTGASVVEICADLLNIDTQRDIGSDLADRGDDSRSEIMTLFEMDHHQMGRMKNSMDKVHQCLEDHRDEFENSKHYESLVTASHIDSKDHPVNEEFSHAADLITKYSAFFDVMSSTINSAVKGAQGDIPEDHLEVYIDR